MIFVNKVCCVFIRALESMSQKYHYLFIAILCVKYCVWCGPKLNRGKCFYYKTLICECQKYHHIERIVVSKVQRVVVIYFILPVRLNNVPCFDISKRILCYLSPPLLHDVTLRDMTGRSIIIWRVKFPSNERQRKKLSGKKSQFQLLSSVK